MTEKLFYKDPYKSEFDAVVRDIKPHDKKDVVEVYLDRTCFYPEGGGQPADIGMIETTEVIDARKSGDDVVHVCREEPRLISGAAVHCTVDWTHRFEFMQQHTGQHLISAALYQAAALNTVSVHLGEEYSTVELEVQKIDEELLLSIEREVNQIICRNIPVQVSHLGEGDPGLADLRRPPKVDGEIRVVAVEGIDKAACGGVHVERTGEVGLVKLIGTESIRGNIRTIWKIGDRAHADYREKILVCAELSKLFSAPTAGIVDEARELAARLVSAQKGAQDLGKKYAAALAERNAEGISGLPSSAVTYRF
ncbi:MAG: alanyl-tRNA editing protein, partial [Spirochaetales bacterium]|nr:alanyl-tRNA editing protein [Spirochaetales bacterium]